MKNQNTSAAKPNLTSNFRPEFIRIQEASRVFGIGRSRLYELIKDKEINSICLRKRGAVRGLRLIDYASLREFLDQLSEQQADNKTKSEQSKTK